MSQTADSVAQINWKTLGAMDKIFNNSRINVFLRKLIKEYLELFEYRIYGGNFNLGTFISGFLPFGPLAKRKDSANIIEILAKF